MWTSIERVMSAEGDESPSMLYKNNFDLKAS